MILKQNCHCNSIQIILRWQESSHISGFWRRYEDANITQNFVSMYLPRQHKSDDTRHHVRSRFWGSGIEKQKNYIPMQITIILRNLKCITEFVPVLSVKCVMADVSSGIWTPVVLLGCNKGPKRGCLFFSFRNYLRITISYLLWWAERCSVLADWLGHLQDWQDIIAVDE